MCDTDPIPDPYTVFGFTQNADGSVTRVSDLFPLTAACSDSANPILTKDVPINHHNSTWARLYLPSSSPATQKLPVIVYYHGSGFVVSSAASSIFQKFCSDIALDTPAVIVSVEYRLAPEHRLPAAYDDCVEALHWLMASDDEWLTAHADLTNCYIMGTSAGANIALHVGMREAARVKIRGLVLHHPFFGGVERTASEVRSADDTVLPPSFTDVMWSMSLPVGADRDHEFCNTAKHLKGEVVEEMKREGWRVLVTGCSGDPLIDRQVEAARVLEENGMNVISDFSEGGFHGIELVDESKARIFNGILKNFIHAL